MPAIPNVIRRGATYYWRRLLPKSAANGLGCKPVLLSISLFTADSGIARQKGARMTAISLDVFEYGRQNMVTQEQLTNIMRHQAQIRYQDLTEQAALERANGGLESTSTPTALSFDETFSATSDAQRIIEFWRSEAYCLALEVADWIAALAQDFCSSKVLVINPFQLNKDVFAV
jgi:hypothetical protein